jgi:SPOR domain
MSWFYEALSRAEKERLKSGNGHESLKEGLLRGYVTGISLALAMASVIFLIGYWLGKASLRSPQATAAAQSVPPAATVGAASDPPPTAAQPPAPATLSLHVPSFVLQVAAVEKEANADALSAALREKNFPAFVFKRETDGLYRVAVGPFLQQGTAGKIQRQLEAQGFKPFLRPWTRE